MKSTLKSINILTALIFLLLVTSPSLATSNADPASTATSHSLWNVPGTTPKLREIFLGRCWDYQIHEVQNRAAALTYDLDCLKLWNTFHHAVAYRSPCNVTEATYRQLFEMLSRKDKPKLVNRTLFWSGSNEMVHQLSKVATKYVTMEDTLPGFVFNKMKWCSSTNRSSDGFNHTSCEGKCLKSQNDLYWKLSSELFSRSASGTAYVLINGTRANNQPAYMNGSFFRSVEIPVMNTVKKLVVLIARNIRKTPREECGTGSLIELESDARRKKMDYECIQEPKLVLRILCLKYPSAEECQVAIEESIINEQWRTIGVIFMSLTLILIIVVLLLLIWRFLARHRYQHKQSRWPIMNGSMHEKGADQNNQAAVML